MAVYCCFLFLFVCFQLVSSPLCCLTDWRRNDVPSKFQCCLYWTDLYITVPNTTMAANSDFSPKPFTTGSICWVYFAYITFVLPHSFDLFSNMKTIFFAQCLFGECFLVIVLSFFFFTFFFGVCVHTFACMSILAHNLALLRTLPFSIVELYFCPSLPYKVPISCWKDIIVALSHLCGLHIIYFIICFALPNFHQIRNSLFFLFTFQFLLYSSKMPYLANTFVFI